MLEDFFNDKINREFLSNHIGEYIEITGKFRTYDRNYTILAEDCTYYDNLLNININLGHMWWQKIKNYKDYMRIQVKALITVSGKIIAYKNNDKSYNSESTYGLDDCTIVNVSKY